jgi:hypothetical protein
LRTPDALPFTPKYEDLALFSFVPEGSEVFGQGIGTSVWMLAQYLFQYTGKRPGIA